MRNFAFDKQRRENPGLKTIAEEIKAISPDDVFLNVHDLLNEVLYACKGSLENRHPDIIHLEAACKNVSALMKCMPILLKDNKAGSILADPQILLSIPDIDPRNISLHFQTLMEAGKIYLGMSNEAVPNSEIAKQFFALTSQLISPNKERGVLERTGKMFARQINDALHAHIPQDDAVETGPIKE